MNKKKGTSDTSLLSEISLFKKTRINNVEVLRVNREIFRIS